MERVDKLVNDILKKWNPLEVPSEIAVHRIAPGWYDTLLTLFAVPRVRWAHIGTALPADRTPD